MGIVEVAELLGLVLELAGILVGELALGGLIAVFDGLGPGRGLHVVRWRNPDLPILPTEDDDGSDKGHARVRGSVWAEGPVADVNDAIAIRAGLVSDAALFTLGHRHPRVCSSPSLRYPARRSTDRMVATRARGISLESR